MRLTSLDTLIDDPLLGSDILSVLQGEAGSITPTATASNVDEAPEPKAEDKAKKAPPKASPSSGKRKPATSQKSASAPKSTKSVEPKAEDKDKKTAPKASSSASKKKSATPPKAASRTAAKEKSQKNTSSASSSILTMNKPYDQMKKIDAITQIMHENPGKVMHYDDLIVRLFGELSKDENKAERGRIKAVMYQGAKNNLWKKANVKMCYIYDPNLNTGPEKSNSTKGQKSRKKT